MNERIKELAEKADAVVYKRYFDPIPAQFPENLQELEKFAELIVRECANVAWQHTPDTEDLGYGYLVECKILEHFGIKDE